MKFLLTVQSALPSKVMNYDQIAIGVVAMMMCRTL
jgi:hypothetical protein